MSGFHHEAVLYADSGEYVAGTVPEVRAALAADGAVLAAVRLDKRRLLEDALGSDGAAVRFVDMQELGRNPACIIPAWREFLVAAGPVAVLGIGEPVWPGRSDAELVECSRHEALLNLTFEGGRPWRLLCPYDTAALPVDVLTEARRNHPHVARDGISEHSHDYEGAQAVLAREDELPEPERRPEQLEFGDGDLALVRHFVAGRGRTAGFSGGRLNDLVLAIHELATNSMRHAGGGGLLRAWQTDEAFYCEIRDHGRISDPLAGRERAPELLSGGRGLWIVNHLCDLVQVRSSPAGTVVRVQMAFS
jgi:anti-sigma regulatory factor (Ser/Thr protein kinase)